MGYYTNHTIKNMELNYNDVEALEEICFELMDKGPDFSVEEFTGFLSGSSTLIAAISLIFPQIPISVASAGTIAGLISLVLPDEAELLEGYLLEGYRGVRRLFNWYKNNTDYDRIRVDMSLLEYVDEGVTFITHTDPNGITGVHMPGGSWTEVQ